MALQSLSRRLLSCQNILFTLLLPFCTMTKTNLPSFMAAITTPADITAFIPATPESLQARVAQTCEHAQRELDTLLAIPTEKRTFTNTAQTMDDIVGEVVVTLSTVEMISMVHPDEAMRNTAAEQMQVIQAFIVEQISHNQKLYHALKAYATTNASKENVTPEQHYFITTTLEDFERKGLGLSPEKLTHIKELEKKIDTLCHSFELTINQDKTTITATKEQLAGLSDDFINELKKTDDGLYIITMDYPTQQQVMGYCSNNETRARSYHAFKNRAYPINEPILLELIALRDELAQELGFESYAAYSLDDQMAKKPATAHAFLTELCKKALPKGKEEITFLLNNLPAGVQATADGKLAAWDLGYVKKQYIKKEYALDENEIAEYFPMDSTLQGLLHIYEQFFCLTFTKMPINGLWHEEVMCLKVQDATTKELLGYSLLDLYPRANKYSHACNGTLIPAVILPDGTKPAALTFMLANFPRPTATKPSLLTYSDVNTFFHEFGHAIHVLLGRTKLNSQSGTSVPTDFVELPSQMLEDWLLDPTILKNLSHHYVTGEPLPNDVIQKKIALDTFCVGLWTLAQLDYSLFSLACYAPGKIKDFYALERQFDLETSPFILDDADTHAYAAFGHLPNYNAKYYGYLWSKVFAKDLFAQIKKEGLLNPAAGKRYVDCVIGKGGSKPAEELLRDFLGRAPNDEAFLQSMGL